MITKSWNLEKDKNLNRISSFPNNKCDLLVKSQLKLIQNVKIVQVLKEQF